jgi:hypothetical protein
VVTAATQQGSSPERLLAAQRWQQIAAQCLVPGVSAEQSAWMQQQQVQAISTAAAQRGVTPEALLAQQRWEQLVGQLPAAAPVPVPGVIPFPFGGS